MPDMHSDAHDRAYIRQQQRSHRYGANQRHQPFSQAQFNLDHAFPNNGMASDYLQSQGMGTSPAIPINNPQSSMSREKSSDRQMPTSDYVSYSRQPTRGNSFSTTSNSTWSYGLTGFDNRVLEYNLPGANAYAQAVVEDVPSRHGNALHFTYPYVNSGRASEPSNNKQQYTDKALLMTSNATARGAEHTIHNSTSHNLLGYPSEDQPDPSISSNLQSLLPSHTKTDYHSPAQHTNNTHSLPSSYTLPQGQSYAQSEHPTTTSSFADFTSEQGMNQSEDDPTQNRTARNKPRSKGRRKLRPGEREEVGLKRKNRAVCQYHHDHKTKVCLYPNTVASTNTDHHSVLARTPRTLMILHVSHGLATSRPKTDQLRDTALRLTPLILHILLVATVSQRPSTIKACRHRFKTPIWRSRRQERNLEACHRHKQVRDPGIRDKMLC